MKKNSNRRLLLLGTVLGIVMLILGVLISVDTTAGKMLRDIGLFTTIICGFNCIYNLSERQ